MKTIHDHDCYLVGGKKDCPLKGNGSNPKRFAACYETLDNPMPQPNEECKKCGLLRSTVLATEKNCLKGAEHDFGDHGVSFPNEELRKEFYKEFTRSFPGDSGFGGNDPQEPVWEVADDPKEIADWWIQKITSQQQALKEKIEVLDYVDKYMETNKWYGPDGEEVYDLCKKDVLALFN